MSNVHRLRELLGIEADQAAMREQGRRVAESQQRMPDVAEVLPDAIRQRSHDDDMAEALREPVSKALHESVTENPHSLVEILFPVMGPAIRRSIAETLRAALEGLNQSLADGFSLRNLRWRLEAWRTGVPFREVVLRHTMTYRVAEALLINKENGLLVCRVGEMTDSPGMDRDAVAAMLTAIEDFVADSTGEEEGELSSAELGDRVLWVLTGPHARLALVLEGQPPLTLRITLRDHLAVIHQDHGTYLHEFSGDEEAPAPLIAKLEKLLAFSAQDQQEAKRRPPRIAGPILLLLLLAGLGAAGHWFYRAHEAKQQWLALEATIATVPGVVWVEGLLDRQPPELKLLADPLADSPSELVRGAGYADGEVQLSVTPFVSAEPQIELRRFVRALAPLPPGVAANLQAGSIVVSGRADRYWYRQLAAHLEFARINVPVDISGLTQIDDGTVSPEAADEER
ncbi:MAG: hypothetical protein AAGI67_09475 [Pseudomonadota bacterium]